MRSNFVLNWVQGQRILGNLSKLTEIQKTSRQKQRQKQNVEEFNTYAKHSDGYTCILYFKQRNVNLLIARKNQRLGCHVDQDNHLEWVTSSCLCIHTFHFRRYIQTRSTETGGSGSRWCTWLRTFLDWHLSPLSGNGAGLGRWIFPRHGHTHWLD